MKENILQFGFLFNDAPRVMAKENGFWTRIVPFVSPGSRLRIVFRAPRGSCFGRPIRLNTDRLLPIFWVDSWTISFCMDIFVDVAFFCSINSGIVYPRNAHNIRT